MGSPTLTNAASGSAGSAIALGATFNTNFSNELYQTFTPGVAQGTFSFQIALNPVTGTTPDSFVFGLFDNSSAFSTSGPNAFELATVDLSKSIVTPASWNTYSYGDDNFTFTTVVTGVPAVPEAGSAVGLAGMGLFSVGSLLRRRYRSTH